MEWTIEKIRGLPEDNWLGIKRVGLHGWQIGSLFTGDGGVLEYVKAFENECRQPFSSHPGLLDQIKEQKEYTNLKLTYKDLERIVGEALFIKKDVGD